MDVLSISTTFSDIRKFHSSRWSGYKAEGKQNATPGLRLGRSRDVVDSLIEIARLLLCQKAKIFLHLHVLPSGRCENRARFPTLACGVAISRIEAFHCMSGLSGGTFSD